MATATDAPQNDGVGDANLRQRVFDQFSLGVRRPNNAARPVAVTKAGPVEHDDAMILGDEIDEAAAFEVLDHAAVTVQEYDGIACAALDVMEPPAVHF
jgi:hypothetical protein